MKTLTSSVLFVALFSVIAFSQKPSSAAPAGASASPATVKLPEAKEIIERYVKALGGRDALSKHKSRYEKGSIELSPMGIKGTVETFSRSDDRALTKLSIDGIGEILEGFDGKTAWTVNPIQGNRVKTGPELAQSKRNSTFRRELNLDKMYDGLKVRGIEKVSERETYVVVASTAGLPDDILYFDTETGLLLRSDSIVVTPEGNQAMSSFYDDYREVDGIKSAFKVRAKTPAFEINTAVSEVKYGVAIEDSKFVQPQ
jgi:zinc protease